MTIVLIVAVVALFTVGLLFVNVYRQRTQLVLRSGSPVIDGGRAPHVAGRGSGAPGDHTVVPVDGADTPALHDTEDVIARPASGEAGSPAAQSVETAGDGGGDVSVSGVGGVAGDSVDPSSVDGREGQGPRPAVDSPSDVAVAGVAEVGRPSPGVDSMPPSQPEPLPSSQSQSDDAAYLRSARRIAEAEAESIRSLALREAEALTRSAQVEASTLSRSAESEAAAALRSAYSEAATTRAAAESAAAEAQRQAQEMLRQVETRDAAVKREADQRAAELAGREQALATGAAELSKRRSELEELRERIDASGTDLDVRSGRLDDARQDLERRVDEHVRELERIGVLSAEQARAELLRTVEERTRRDAAVLVRNIENEARAKATMTARAIVAEAVQRCASEQTTETVVSVLQLPSEEMKGRIIGREGRNIRSFESVTGVNVLIDDTPEAVLLSCFDPTRREIGRLTLERLVADGRIHPHRIEEAFEQSKDEVEQLCLRAATDALADVGIGDLDERLLPTLGRLRYRTSYGQNVLAHLVETAHISGVMAAELGVDPVLVKRCAFLHDIGKALTHEVQGSHAIVGAELLRKYGESEAVAHAVEAHHDEVAPRTIEAVLTQASDACSAARPGARRETLETYVKRLSRIEEIATDHDGVDKVFAMQAGREVRVMVHPDSVDDLESAVIARDIAKQIESELTFPGQIRVTVIRESRVTEVAH